MSETQARRSGGRSGNTRRGSPRAIEQMPWAPPVNSDRPTEPVDAAGVEAIHDCAMRILEELGIEFLNEEARDILANAGCTVNGDNVRMDRDFVMKYVAMAPAEFTITPRNPDRAITLGGKNMVFVNVSSPPNSMDLDRGRRDGTLEDMQNFLRLCQSLNPRP